MNVQPTSIPVDPTPRPPAGPGGPSKAQVDSLILQRMNAQDASGQPNEFQIVDQLSISPQAKSALENTLATQVLTLAQGEHGSMSSTQAHYVYNGNVYKALQSYASGQSSLQDVTSAIQARGQRMDAILNGYQGPTPTPTMPAPPAPPAPAPTPVTSGS